MLIGVPKEVKSNEFRVALTPSGAAELIKCGHTVLFEKNCGSGSGFSDQDYIAIGAQRVETPQELFSMAEMVVKVKEPQPTEYSLIKSGQIIFTYFHFASSLSLTKAMLDSGSICIAYETVKQGNSLPLLIPMSEIAGRMSIQEGAKYLEKPMGGAGILLGGVPGVPPANVVIIGGGIVGVNAAKMAAGLGANVKIFDINLERLRTLSDFLPANVTTIFSNSSNIAQAVKEANLVVGAVLIPGAKAPILVSRNMLQEMRPGSVLIDVAVDQGGCIETCKPTTHDNPTYIIDDIVHYCVANMPGAVPQTSTLALTNATLPFIQQLAGKGWKRACMENSSLKEGLNIVQGCTVYAPLAESLNLIFTNPLELL